MAISYDDSSIKQLKGAERVRVRPEALLGSNGIDGARHTIYEIVGNASDENLAGYGEDLIISLYDDGSISVRDFGRGVPLGWNEKEQNWNYYLIYEELYAGGKYGTYQEELKKISGSDWASMNIKKLLDMFPYLFKVGLNGLGAAATQCTSEFCEVTSYRDGVARTMKYKEGSHILDELIEEKTSEKNGTFVHWKPDIRVFSDVNIGAKWLAKLCKNLSYTADFNVTFNNCGNVTLYEKSSIKDHMISEVGFAVTGENFHHEIDEVGDICICYAQIVLASGGVGNEYFHNKIEIKGGVHAEAVNTAESDFFYERAKERGISLRNSDYSGKLSSIISTLSNKVSYRGQTKDSIDDMYVYRCIKKAVYDTLKLEWDKGAEWIADVVDEVIQNAENRIAVQELSKNIRDVEKAVKSTKASEKFIPCTDYIEKRYENVEYHIVEGDSAGNSAKNARSSVFQCIQKIRGKSLNVFKAPITKILENREIRDIAAALGCGVDMNIEGIETFDITKLKVSKIFFTTDADIDGLHIRMLLFLIFYRLFPELLYQGRVYITQTPRFVIILKNDESIYCMDDKELAEKRAEVGERNIREITRFKGLGELNPKQLWDTTFNPETRITTQIKIDRNDMDVYDVLEVFFGKSTDRRKKAILGSMMGTDFDDVMGNIEDMIEYIEGLDLSEVEYEDIIA